MFMCFGTHQSLLEQNGFYASLYYSQFEVADLVMPRVVKSNDVREPFNEEKLRSGMLRALEKRPVSSDDAYNLRLKRRQTTRG